MRRMFENRSEAREIGRRAQEHVREHFSAGKAVDRMEARLREVCPNSSAGHVPVRAPSASPIRFLWIGTQPTAEGLHLLLSCYCAVFEAQDKVALTVASAKPESDEPVRRAAEAFGKLIGRPILFTAFARTRGEREAILRAADAFVFPSSVDEVSGFCREAAELGVPLIASEASIPATLREERYALGISCLKSRAGSGPERRLVCKPFPNVLGGQLRWLFMNAAAARSMGLRAAQKLRDRSAAEESSPIPWFSADSKKPAPAGYERRPLHPTVEGGGPAGALNWELRRANGEFLAVTAGQAVPAVDALKALLSDPQAVLFARSSTQGAFLLLRVRKALAFTEFEPFFDGITCLLEFARAVRAQGGLVLQEGEVSCPIVSKMELAENHCAVGRFPEAITLLREVLERRPDYPAALVLLARLLRDQNGPCEEREAEELLWRLLALQPLHVPGRILLGELAFQKGEAEGALEHFDLASKVEPANPGVWNDLGVVLAGRGETQEALECFERALSLGGENLDAAENREALLQLRAEEGASR